MVIGGLNEVRGESILDVNSEPKESKVGGRGILKALKIEQPESSQLGVQLDKGIYTLTYKGSTATDFWIHTNEIPKKGVYGMKVSPLETNPGDNYFGFGVLRKSYLASKSVYLCYTQVQGKFIDVRNGSICGSGEEQLVQNGWTRCCSKGSEITVKVDFNKKQFIFLLNGSNQFTRDFISGDDSYVFVFDPYYIDTKFSVQFFHEKK